VTRNLRLCVFGALVILYLPLLVVILMSFNESPYGTFPFSFTLKWYDSLLGSNELLLASWRSVWLSLVVATLAAIIGTMLAIWRVATSSNLGVATDGLLVATVAVPWLILGIAMLQIFNLLGIGRGTVPSIAGNTVVVLPYVVFVVVARLRGLDENLVDAARSLGATSIKAFYRISLPLALPAIIGGALLAFVICFNNFTIQYFLLPLGVRTLPLEIYSQVRTGYSPAINALATVILGTTVVLAVILEKLGAGSRQIRAKGNAWRS